MSTPTANPSSDTAPRSDTVEVREAPQQTQALLDSLIDHSPHAIWISDAAGTLIRLNQACRDLLHVTDAEVVGKYNVLQDDVVAAQGLLPLVRKVFERGEVVRFSIEYDSAQIEHLELAERAVVSLDTTISPVRDATGTVTNAIVQHIDTTARNRAENALRNSEKRYRAIADNVADVIWLLDVNAGKFTYVSPSVEKQRGYTPDEVRAQSWEQSLTPESLQRVVADLPARLAAIAAGDESARVQTSEIDQPRKDGSIVHTEVVTTFLPETAGRVEIVGVTRDVTERKRVEESNRRAQKLEALGTLAGGIAHDFNNILLAIGGNARLASADLPATHPAQESLAAIAKATTRAANLVRQIMAFSSPQEHQRRVVDPRRVVEEALQLLRATLPAMIEIHAELPNNLPAIVCDANQIHQALVNLLTNAAQAIGDRTGHIDVRLRALQVDAELAQHVPAVHESTYVLLSVSDDGCGMEASTLARIFDPFFTTKPPGVGSGLGLSVVHGIMKSHGGAVSAHSKPGRGSTFWLFFPAATGALDATPSAPVAPAGGHSERVLFVDDESPLVVLVTRVLSRLGYRVTGDTDPVRALEVFTAQPDAFDALVTDLAMPGMSGFELTRAVRAIRPDVPVLMTSGYVRPQDQEAAVAAGVRELILKPDAVDELGRALDRALRAIRRPGD